MAEDVARDVFRLPEPARSDVRYGKIGSGEGIPKLFGDYAKVPGQPGTQLVFQHSRALSSTPEIDSLAALFKRDSSTLSAALREAWTGSLLGNDYANRERRVLVQARRYRFCLSVGVQPEHGGPLFGDATGGLLQRFIFAAVTDPDLADPTGARDDLVPVELPAFPRESRDLWLSDMGAGVTEESQVTLLVPTEVRAEVLDARRRGVRNEQDGVDGHRLLLMEKVALGFAVIHGRIDGFDLAHWDMAHRFMAHSDEVRETVEAALRGVESRRREARARGEGESAVIRDETQHGLLLAKTKERVTALLGSGATAQGVLRKKLSNPQRDHFDQAIEELLQNGVVLATVLRDSEGGRKGTSYALAPPRSP
jgi:hypothetical protein